MEHEIVDFSYTPPTPRSVNSERWFVQLYRLCYAISGRFLNHSTETHVLPACKFIPVLVSAIIALACQVLFWVGLYYALIVMPSKYFGWHGYLKTLGMVMGILLALVIAIAIFLFCAEQYERWKWKRRHPQEPLEEAEARHVFISVLRGLKDRICPTFYIRNGK